MKKETSMFLNTFLGKDNKGKLCPACSVESPTLVGKFLEIRYRVCGGCGLGSGGTSAGYNAMQSMLRSSHFLQEDWSLMSGDQQ